MNNEIYVTLLDKPENQGDWHDKPLKYKVCGPAEEVQKFSTKREALRYKSIRARSADFRSSVQSFVL